MADGMMFSMAADETNAAVIPRRSVVLGLPPLDASDEVSSGDRRGRNHTAGTVDELI